jgi:CTP-dependent riboflavin kinase
MGIVGVVSSGLGRAHIFMSQHHYQEQFKTVIGMSAWPGTLNVTVEGDSLRQYQKLRVTAGLDEGEPSGITSHRIKGFDRDGVSFGGATAFLASIKCGEGSHDCAILIPDLTRHEDVVEVIAGIFLREACDLNDGDEVSIDLR